MWGGGGEEATGGAAVGELPADAVAHAPRAPELICIHAQNFTAVDFGSSSAYLNVCRGRDLYKSISQSAEKIVGDGAVVLFE